MEIKNILVTGGAGFVGSHLCQRLSQMGYSVVSLDNYFTGSEDNHVENVSYIRGNTESINEIRMPVPDLIYHLGEYSRVEQSFEDSKIVFDYNIKGTLAVLEYVKRNGSKLVYSGSSTKFADQTPGYVMSPYAWSKATNTELVKKYGEWFGIKYAITYFYNVYGPREIQTGKYATLIAKFADKMRKGNELTVVNPGTQKRNFTHVYDIVDALVTIGKYGKGDEYGIGHPDSYTVLDVAKLFGGDIKMVPERKGNRMSSPVVSDKTVALGWKPKHNLEKYIGELNL